MTLASSLTVPSASDDDLKWICGVLALDETASSGPDGTDARLGLLQSRAEGVRNFLDNPRTRLTVQRMSALVDDLLAVARADAGIEGRRDTVFALRAAIRGASLEAAALVTCCWTWSWPTSRRCCSARAPRAG